MSTDKRKLPVINPQKPPIDPQEPPIYRREQTANFGKMPGEGGNDDDDDTPARGPDIQPPGSFPDISEAFADMSEPPPAPRIRHSKMKRSSVPPQEAFRVQRRIGNGVFLHMFPLPYGTALQGEAFDYPFVAPLKERLARECPQLVQKRYEIRLLRCASGAYSLLEVPADHAPTKRGEDTRKSLLRALEHGEMESVVVQKVAGLWTWQPSTYDIPKDWNDLEQSIFELATLTYQADLIGDMDHPVLQRFRKKI